MMVLILLVLGLMGLGGVGNMMARNNMTADEHRAEAANLLKASLNSRRRSMIDAYYNQAMAHLQLADEMDRNTNGRPTN